MVPRLIKCRIFWTVEYNRIVVKDINIARAIACGQKDKKNLAIIAYWHLFCAWSVSASSVTLFLQTVEGQDSSQQTSSASRAVSIFSQSRVQ